MAYRRIVAKMGTSLLTAGSDRLDLGSMARLVTQVVKLREQGLEVVVVSSGARAAGRHRLARRIAEGHTPSRQAFASVGQGHLMQSWHELFDWHDVIVAQVLLTRRDLADRLGYLNARSTLLELLGIGVVPIVNENDAVALDAVLASRIGENDSLAAYVANLVDADLLVILTDVDGFFDDDPRTNPAARLIPRIEHVDRVVEAAAQGAGTYAGSGGMATKLTAANIAAQSGVDVLITNGARENVLLAAAAGSATGTLFPAVADRIEGRKRWLLANIARTGHIVVDSGAAEALRRSGRSLLPAGVAAITGHFARGDTVEVRDAAGALIGAGTANYESTDLARIRGQRSDRILEVLGFAYGDEAIHRDNLVLL
jgi:glutamate 5-kinase